MKKQKPGEDNCNIYNVQRLNNNNKKKHTKSIRKMQTFQF